MQRLIDTLFWGLIRLILRLRYRVQTTGLDSVAELQGPVLVLPNHPCYVDPPTVLSQLNLGLAPRLRPLVFSGTYRIPFLLPLMKLVGAFEVPDLSAQSRSAAARTQELIDAVAQRVEQGDSFLIYPSGRLQRTNLEVLGSARFVYELVKRCPELQIVVVRTRGLWGSLWGCARTGQPPNLTGTVLEAAGWLLAGLVFFLPRRQVRLHVERLPRDQLPLDSREAFNKHLEDWFNIDAPAEPLFVRYNWLFGPTEGHYQPPPRETIDPAILKPKTIEQVNELVAGFLKRELGDDEQQATTRLEDLGLDSLDRMELALRIEQQFGFHSDSVVDTLGGLWALAEGKLAAHARSAKPLEVPKAWFAPLAGGTARGGNDEPGWLLDETVASAFVRRMLEAPDTAATGDPMTGLLSRRRLLVGASLMARRFAQIREPHVGVMLPASVAADLAFYGLHLAGKTPVMMNWTTGPANLAHGIRATGVKQVITSSRLVDRLGLEIEGADYLFLEEVKKSVGKAEAVSTMLASRLRPGSLLKQIPDQREADPAVFLFTSGSESAPKTVPLSHRNLFTNILDGLDVLKPDAHDTLLGFLPPFHSFGLTGNVLLPQVAGIRSVRYADPTDAPGLVRLIAAYKPTMLFTTPTFLNYILNSSTDGDLTSLHKIITGAEACPETTYDLCRAKAPDATILEGYGITECSPVVAANRLDKIKHGTIGRPVGHVESLIVHHETGEPVNRGETGMLLVRGDSVFSGYYAYDGPSPFVEHEGQNWYRTGDLVSADEDGYLKFEGRLKRFLKAGGEMISLPAIEAPLQRAFPADENGPRVAVEGIETPDGRQIVLFTTLDLTLREASDILLEAGLRGVMRLDEVRKVDAIPVLGTGKTDYKTLRGWIEQAAGANVSQ